MSTIKNDAYYGSKLFELIDGQPPVKPSKIAQFKEVDPSLVEQIVRPDPEYFYLSAVQVNPVKLTRTPNAFGGTTVRIMGG